MIFIYFTSSLLIINNIITHNCNNSNIYPIPCSNETINYKIACESNKVQRINISNQQYDSFVSIYDYSNVIISCPILIQNSVNLYLSIYGEPNITFENYCSLNKIEIHGSPKFQFSNNSFIFVDTLILYNQDYSFPFNYANIFYFKNISKMFISNLNITSIQNFNNNNFKCDNELFNVSLNDNYIIVKCGSYYEYTLLYSSLLKKTFNLNNKLIAIENNCKSNVSINQNMKIALSSFHFIGDKKITIKNFQNLNKFDCFSSYTKKDMNGTWMQIENNTFRCFWETDDDGKYQDLFDQGWKKVCRDDDTYLYCCDSDLGPRKINFISKEGSLAIIIVILCTIFIVFTSLCIIAYVRYNNMRKTQNMS